MCTMKKFLICVVVASVKITCCLTQTTGDGVIGISSSIDGQNLVEESSYSSETPNEASTTAIDLTLNPCFSAEKNFEHSEEDVKPFVTRRRKREYSVGESNHKVRRNQTAEFLLSNETIKRFSDHFMNCIHIGMEPGTFDFFSNGSLHIPRLSMVLDKYNFCQDDTTGIVFICDERITRNITEPGTQKPKPKIYGHLSDEFLNCSGHFAFKKGSFETRPDRSVYVPVYDRVFDYSNYLIREDGQLYICPEFFHKEKKASYFFEIVTVVGLSVSLLFIAAYMISFILLASLRNLPGYCLFSLCLSLQTAYICFLLRSIGLTHQECEHLVLSILYFFLAAFFWMNVLSFDVWRSLKMATSKLRLSSDSMMWKRFALYSTYAWLSPLLIVIFSIIFTKYGGSVKFLKLEFHQDLCWFTTKGPLFVYMVLPLVILMCLNVIFFSTSFVMINKASMNTADNMATFWKKFFLFLRLAVIMGVAWIFGIIAAATNVMGLFFVFILLNTLQGVFIFFSFAFNEKTRKEWKKKMKMRKSSVGQTQITSQQEQNSTSV